MTAINKMKQLASVGLLGVVSCSVSAESIDASDPTKVYSYAGPGYKFTEYTNGDSLQELRVIGNIGISDNDMVLFEIGYGSYKGTVITGDKDTGITNMRARWFHLNNMDYSIESGYRGWATQVDLQVEGEVNGTVGNNTLAIGALPAFGVNADWSFYLPINYVSTWGKDFDQHMGHGVSVAPMMAYAPAEGLWDGFFLQIWPSYTRYFAGDLKSEGSANIDFTLGGSFTETVVGTVTFQKNLDKNFKELEKSYGPRGANDWNVFASASFYF